MAKKWFVFDDETTKVLKYAVFAYAKFWRGSRNFRSFFGKLCRVLSGRRVRGDFRRLVGHGWDAVAVAPNIGDGCQNHKGDADRKEGERHDAGFHHGEFHRGLALLIIAALAAVFIGVVGALAGAEFTAVSALFSGWHIVDLQFVR